MPTTYAIPDGRTVMAATTFNGITGGTQTITNTVNGVGFQPDFVWMKLRSGVQDHFLVDSNRGASNILVSDSTAAEITGATTFVTSFNSNGWSLGSGGYGNGTTVIGWNWKAGGTSSSNTNGSITSTVSVGATQGFSVVTFTATGSTATIGHGLGVVPNMIIVRDRSVVANWWVYHSVIGNTGGLILNSTSATTTASTIWNNTSPTSSVFTIAGVLLNNGDLGVAYCFAAVKGFSAFGSYTGNGSTDGPFVYTGFRPRFILIKNSTTAGTDWDMYDSSRSTYNESNAVLRADTSAAEISALGIDFLSNGFKIRNTGTDINTSGATMVYACFAENAFKFANAR